jgi:hypothetical protein
MGLGGHGCGRFRNIIFRLLNQQGSAHQQGLHVKEIRVHVPQYLFIAKASLHESLAQGININPGHCIKVIFYGSIKISTFTFRLRPPLTSMSRVNFDEFFRQAGLHRTT